MSGLPFLLRMLAALAILATPRMGASKTILYTERFGSKADRRVLLTALRHFVGDDRSRPHPPVFGNGATRPTHQRGRDGERPRQYLMIGVVEPITALTAVAVTMMIVMAGAPVARTSWFRRSSSSAWSCWPRRPQPRCRRLSAMPVSRPYVACSRRQSAGTVRTYRKYVATPRTPSRHKKTGLCHSSGVVSMN